MRRGWAGAAALGVLASWSTAAMADGARPSAAALDEVVVTAERTSRTLRDTAASVMVATADEVAGTPGAYTTSDMLLLVPNMVAIRTGNAGPIWLVLVKTVQWARCHRAVWAPPPSQISPLRTV